MYSSLKSHGLLFRYGEKRSQVAFRSGNHSRQVILVGGLTDGLLSLPYAINLQSALDKQGWSFVHAQLSSSYTGFGISSLNEDADELFQLISHLKESTNCNEFLLLGHSTGTQDCIRFVKRHGENSLLPKLRGIILQAPVSDQEINGLCPEIEDNIRAAEALKCMGKGEDILLRDKNLDDAPLTANRYLSLYQRRGDDDMFSTYLSDSELKRLLGHMEKVNCLILLSEKDEYVPAHIDLERLGERLVAAMGSSSKYTIIKDGTHDLSNGQEAFIHSVLSFLDETEPVSQKH